MGGALRIRTAWQQASLVLLLIVCGNLIQLRPANGADPGPAISGHQQAEPSSGQAGQDVPVSVLLPHMSPAWFLNRTRQLLHEGRAAEAHQLAQAGLDLYPHSAELRLGAAFAAMRTSRCQLAIRHLAPLRGAQLAPAVRRRAEGVRTACQGPWRHEAVIGATVGYRPSLVDRQGDVKIRLQPGSELHMLCVRLISLCNPDQPFFAPGKRDSGVDLWLNLTVRNLYRAGGDWDFDLDTTLFQRRPRRSGYAGHGAILRAAATYRKAAARQVRIGAETGLSRFQQGRPDLEIAQTHRRADIGLFFAHMAGLQSHIGVAYLTARSRWLDLARARYEYRLEKSLGGGLTMSLGGVRERSRQSAPGLMPGSRAREISIGLRWAGDHVAAQLHQARRHEVFIGRLPFLAAPHRARTRTTRLDLITAALPRWLNLKVVISFEYRKISTLDPFRLPSSKTLLLRISREIFSR